MADAPGDGKNTPRVSVVIPVYERTELFEDSLDSVFAQTIDDWEIIVVADHRSVDKITSLTDTYDDDRLRVVVDEGGGVSNARNAGISEAEGEFIAFLDSDDIWHPEKLERQLERFEEEDDSDLGLVYTKFVHHELNGQQYERCPEVSGDVYVKQLESDHVHPPSTVMIRRDCLENVGGFDPDLPTREDYELWIRVSAQYRIGYVDEILVTKREQADSLSKDFMKRIKGDLAVFKQVQERVAEEDLGFVTKNRIYSAHHLVIGRDYESNGDRGKAVRHLSKAVVLYPPRINAWAMLLIALLGVDRSGPFLMFVKKIIWS